MRAATLAVRQIIAQSKNPATTLGQMSPSGVAFHAAWEAIRVHHEVYDAELAEAYREMNAAPFTDEELFSRLWGNQDEH